MKITSMRRDIEKLLIWLVPLIFLSKVAEAVNTAAFNKLLTLSDQADITSWPVTYFMSQGYSIGELLQTLQWVQLAPGLLVNVFVGFWLYFQAKKTSGRKWVWFISGVCLSYWAIAFHLFSLVLTTERTAAESPSSHSD